MSKTNVKLSVGRGEKLSVKAGGGLTAKGRAKYNRATGSNLQAPTLNSLPASSHSSLITLFVRTSWKLAA